MPEGIWLRLLLGLLVGTALVLGLNWWAEGKEEKRLAQVAAKVRPKIPDPLPGHEALAALQGRTQRFHLARQLSALPRGCAPVLQIAASGALRIPVAAPLPEHPGAVTWPEVGILVPVENLAQLSPDARATLLQIWSRLRPAKGLDAGDLSLHGCEMHPDSLRRLLRWVR